MSVLTTKKKPYVIGLCFMALALISQGGVNAAEPKPTMQQTTATSVANKVELTDFSAIAKLPLENLDAALRDVALKQLGTLSKDADLDLRFRLHVVAGNYKDALQDILRLREQRASNMGPAVQTLFVQYEVWLHAQLRRSQIEDANTRDAAYVAAFTDVFSALADLQAYNAFGAFLGNANAQQAQLKTAIEQAVVSKESDSTAVVNLLRQFMVYRVYRDLLPRTENLMATDDARRYAVQDDVLIRTPEGVSLSAIVMHKRDAAQPAVMMLNIYTDYPRLRNSVREMAAHGYAGVMLDARGKRLSTDTITPYQNDGADANAAIDWVSKQPWCNGSVGMFGGSYSGYAQWAAARYAHPALKAIVPAVAAIPGQGLPMENNIFLNANYAWAFYVANNRFLDKTIYADRERWNNLNTRWFESGRPYREIDAVDGTPNPWLQERLQHPSFDRYWQRNIPWQQDYAKINIPVLSITGYFDDGQISALEYYHQHLKYNPQANHTLLIGPWDHFGSQQRPAAVVNEYRVDPVALQPVGEIIFQWLDHILKGAPRPAILADRVNYQLMGTNTWQHAPSLLAAAPEALHLYLQTNFQSTNNAKSHQLASERPSAAMRMQGHRQTVDLADRKSSNNNAYYPWPVVRDELDTGDAPVFVSAPLTQAMDVVGRFSADLALRINKRDVDIGLTLFEKTANGKYFHLGYFLGRASYVRDGSKRNLLKPGVATKLNITRSRMTAKRLAVGSRLVLVADVNKNANAQVNYGTGKDVSTESIRDAGKPLQIEWLNDSALHLSVKPVR